MLLKTACLRIRKRNGEQEFSEGLHDAEAWKIIFEGQLYESEVGQIRCVRTWRLMERAQHSLVEKQNEQSHKDIKPNRFTATWFPTPSRAVKPMQALSGYLHQLCVFLREVGETGHSPRDSFPLRNSSKCIRYWNEVQEATALEWKLQYTPGFDSYFPMIPW